MTATHNAPEEWLETQPVAGHKLLELKRRRDGTALFMAHDERRGATVAVKVIWADAVAHPDAALRFFEDARSVARLRHPAVARTFNAGRLGPACFWLAREWVRGESLEDRLARRERGRLTERETLLMARGAAEGLRGLFEQGLTHGRLTAGNALLAEGGGAAAPAATEGDGGEGAPSPVEAGTLDEMLDSLLARPKSPGAGAKAAVRLTDAGVCMALRFPDEEAARRAYACHASPEQSAGDPNIDIRSDLYSLGSLWHMALLGAPPFKGEPDEQLRRRQEEDAPAARELDPRISSATSRLIGWLLSREREERPRTPQEFLAKLAQHPFWAE